MATTMANANEITSSMLTIAGIQAELGRKFEVADMVDAVLRREAVTFLREYTGTFAFLLDVRVQAQAVGKLTPAQAKGVLNCAAGQYRYQMARRAGAPVAEAAPVGALTGNGLPVAPVVPNGYYTVVLASGERRTIRLDDADWAKGQRAGTQAAYFLSGPDNQSDYVFFAFVQGGNAFVSRKHQGATVLVEALRALLALDKLGWKQAGEAYAIESSRCARCNRMLTVPSSVSAGYGPVCAKALNL